MIRIVLENRHWLQIECQRSGTASLQSDYNGADANGGTFLRV